MTKLTAYAIAAALSAVLGTTAYAQGRHDEKPHGQGKASAAPDIAASERTPGRHDERPHGVKKSKTASAKKADAKKAEPK